jgi:hypothetical protein
MRRAGCDASEVNPLSEADPSQAPHIVQFRSGVKRVYRMLLFCCIRFLFRCSTLQNCNHNTYIAHYTIRSQTLCYIYQSPSKVSTIPGVLLHPHVSAKLLVGISDHTGVIVTRVVRTMEAVEAEPPLPRFEQHLGVVRQPIGENQRDGS